MTPVVATQVGSMIGILWIVSWLVAIAFVGDGSTSRK